MSFLKQKDLNKALKFWKKLYAINCETWKNEGFTCIDNNGTF